MLNAFWQGVAGGLATQWVQRVFAPAFLFWTGGFLCLVWRDGWGKYQNWWAELDPGQLILIIAGALILIASSGAIVQRFDAAMLRLMEGYWPRWLGVRNLRRRLVNRLNQTIENDRRLFDTLQEKGLDMLTSSELEQLVRADSKLHYTPPKASQRMPTQLGNILRSAERRPRDRYGLEIVYVWPRLWLLLPDQVRKDVANARTSLNANVRLIFWGLLFILWSVVAWWAFIPGIVTAILAYHWALDRGKTYGDLLESSFDLYRFELYRVLHWPLPKISDQEKTHGERLTQYLYRGYTDAPICFKHEDAAS